MHDPVYLDFNATTPVAPEVLDAMLPFLRQHYGDPSSAHVPGRRVAKAVAQARVQVAALLGAGEEEIVFAGCATEANNLAPLVATELARQSVAEFGADMRRLRCRRRRPTSSPPSVRPVTRSTMQSAACWPRWGSTRRAPARLKRALRSAQRGGQHASPEHYDSWCRTPRGAWIGEVEFRQLVDLLRPRPGESLLDVGCGTGWFSRRFAREAGLRVTGIDPDAQWLAFAQSLPRPGSASSAGAPSGCRSPTVRTAGGARHVRVRLQRALAHPVIDHVALQQVVVYSLSGQRRYCRPASR
jgi:hypothetical protein